MKRRSSERRVLGALSLVTVMALAGCGSNVPDERIEAAGNVLGRVSTTQAPAGGDSVALNPAVPAGGPVAAPDAPVAAAAGQAPAAAGTGAQAPAPDGTSATRPGKANGSGTGAAAAPAPPQCTQSLAPVVIGQTLATNGLIGAAISTMRSGLNYWVQQVNARGGLACHPVRLVSLDDGSDPGRVASNIKTLVNSHGAIAIVGAGIPLTAAAARSAANQLKVPIIGGDNDTEDWGQDPYLFPQGGATVAAFAGGTIAAALDNPSAKKTGILYCVEATACTAYDRGFVEAAKWAKLEAGPRKAISLTQSDFTAECQTMKDAKVDVVVIAADGSAASRIARSCASLQYKPIISIAGIALSPTASADPNLRGNKSYLGSTLAPSIATDTAGGKDFQAAVKAYAGNTAINESTMLGYASGKLFEAAITAVATEARTGPLTTALALKGLWKLKDEKLGGLSPGVSFSEGKPAVQAFCYFGLRLDSSGFSALQGSKPQCPK